MESKPRVVWHLTSGKYDTVHRGQADGPRPTGAELSLCNVVGSVGVDQVHLVVDRVAWEELVKRSDSPMCPTCSYALNQLEPPCASCGQRIPRKVEK